MSFTQLDLWSDRIDDEWLSFEKAKALVHTWDLEYQEDRDAYCNGKLIGRSKKPQVIYRYPELAYREQGWTNWKDWLG